MDAQEEMLTVLKEMNENIKILISLQRERQEGPIVHAPQQNLVDTLEDYPPQQLVETQVYFI